MGSPTISASGVWARVLSLTLPARPLHPNIRKGGGHDPADNEHGQYWRYAHERVLLAQPDRLGRARRGITTRRSCGGDLRRAAPLRSHSLAAVDRQARPADSPAAATGGLSGCRRPMEVRQRAAALHLPRGVDWRGCPVSGVRTHQRADLDRVRRSFSTFLEGLEERRPDGLSVLGGVRSCGASSSTKRGTVRAGQPLIDQPHGGPGGSAIRAGRLRQEQVISGLGSRR